MEKFTRIVLTILLVLFTTSQFSSVFGAVPKKTAAARSVGMTNSPDMTSVLKRAGDDSVLSKKLSFQPVLSRKPITAAFLENNVTLEDGKTEKLGNVLKKAFDEQDHFAQSAGRVAGQTGVLKGPIRIQDEVLEFDDSFAVVKSTSVVVSNPQALAQSSPEFGEYLGGGHSSFRMAQLKPEGFAGLQNFMNNEIKDLPEDDPIRQAAETGGEDAVVQAIAAGKGSFEIVDTVVVPKRAFKLVSGQLQMPTLKNGVFSYSSSQAFKGQKINFRPIVFDLDNIEIPRTPSPVATSYEAAVSESSGNFPYKTQFLAGFTRGDSWEWERRWNYTSGFFRITLMGSYGIGMRIPIEVSGELAPTNVFIKDIKDRNVTVHNTAQAYALNGNAEFYRNAGLSNGLIFDGHEGVLQVRFGWGCRFRALWMNIYHNPNSWDLDFDHSVDFTPPFGDHENGFDIAIPASLTNTQLDLGVISGSAEAGLNVSGKGRLELDYKTFKGSDLIKSQKIHFDNRESKDFSFELPAIQTDHCEDQMNFGFSWSRPEYHADISLTPEIRVRVHVGYGDLSRNFNTGWVRLNSMKIDLGGITFGRHPGTRSEFKYAHGAKKFQKIDAGSQAPITPFLSDHSGKYVRAGVGRDSRVAATSNRMDAWEKFQFFGSPDGKTVSIRSFQNGKYLAPVGPGWLLTASMDSIGTITQFVMEEYPDGTFSLYSFRLQKYVRAGVGANQESYLAAVSPWARAWEKFRFTPKPPPAPAPAPTTATQHPTSTSPEMRTTPASTQPSTHTFITTPVIKPVTFNYNPKTGTTSTTATQTPTSTKTTTAKTSAKKSGSSKLSVMSRY